jgi:uncharacterized protein (DUF305 family)
MRYTRVLAALFTATAMFLTGCASEADSNSADAPQSNQADVKFVRGMIPHHRQALQMARLAQGRAADPGVEQLARQIEAAQGPEIETMQGWLRAWDKPLTPEMGGSMDHGDGSMSGMSGMMGTSDMQQLRSVEGEAFDESFLSMMIEHHKGAIDMAGVEVRHGANPHAIALAKTIHRAQVAEIQKMTRMLES